MPRTGPGLGPATQRIVAQARARLEVAAEALKDDVQARYNTPGTGRVYRRYAPKRTHQASRPGDPPASDTGTLRSSVTVTPTERGFRVGTTQEYAPYLEFGTARIAPRPAWRPALERLKSLFHTLVPRGTRG